jgi:hypothetical protein
MATPEQSNALIEQIDLIGVVQFMMQFPVRGRTTTSADLAKETAKLTEMIQNAPEGQLLVKATMGDQRGLSPLYILFGKSASSLDSSVKDAVFNRADFDPNVDIGNQYPLLNYAIYKGDAYTVRTLLTRFGDVIVVNDDAVQSARGTASDYARDGGRKAAEWRELYNMVRGKRSGKPTGPAPVAAGQGTPCDKLLSEKGINDRNTFKQWSLTGHPDKGGDTQVFQQVSDCVDKKYPKGGKRRTRRVKKHKTTRKVTKKPRKN